MSEPITRELRDVVERSAATPNCHVVFSRDIIDIIADRIDAEHERRMLDCRREVRRDAIRYMRGVLNDYDRDIKRVRKCDKEEVVRCKDCKFSDIQGDDRYYCNRHVMRDQDADDYCSSGVRRDQTNTGF